jgi:eukaryotic-like serine/threonine-protein kinase
MDSDRWEQVQALFHEAADLSAPERRSFLQTAAHGDQQLIAEVQALLDQDAQTSLLDDNLTQLVERIFPQPISASLPLQEFGPYRIRGVIGEGGMGIVYLARREDLGSFAAIKLLRDAWMSPARRERFAAEQRTLAQLSHPSIARLYDADTLADGTPWFAMEYVNGLPLTEYCLQHQAPLEQRLELFCAVCEAVRYAHSRAVIHRDLKPSNILVQPDGSVKLLDFGIAKQLGDGAGANDQTRTGLQHMTPAYAAPEQIRGEQPGTYTDVYALGVILYELLTGQLPFNLAGRSAGEAEAIILNHEPERPSACAQRQSGYKLQLAKRSWADLDVLCLTALHKDPERRYRSVDALVRDIQHYLAQQPLDARRDTLPYRIGKFVRRHRRLLATVTLAAATLAILIVYYTVRLTAARNAALAEAARTQRILRFTLNLFNGGDRDAGPASDLRVTTLIDRGLAEARSLDRDPAIQAELYETLGEVYQKLGEFNRADALLTSVLARRRALFGSNSLQVAGSLVALGLLRADEARFDEAERLVRQALQIDQRILPPTDPALAAATHALGMVLEDRGDYKNAKQVLEEAVRLRSTPGSNQADLAASLMELANTDFYAGRYAESEALNRRLLLMHTQLYGASHPLVADDLINLGAIQQDLGHYSEAERFHRQALAITQAFYGKDHYKTAENLTLIARALVKQNRLDEAVALLQQALAIQEKVFGKSHPQVASPLNDLAMIAVARRNFDEAEADFRRMLSIYRQAYAGKHYLIGIALANIGSVYMAQQQNAQAEDLYRQALAMFAQTLPPGSLNEGITRAKLGRVLLRQKRFQEAETESISGYRILSKQANPSVTYLRNAREDLAAAYTALHEPGKARAFQDEQAKLSHGP